MQRGHVEGAAIGAAKGALGRRRREGDAAGEVTGGGEDHDGADFGAVAGHIQPAAIVDAKTVGHVQSGLRIVWGGAERFGAAHASIRRHWQSPETILGVAANVAIRASPTPTKQTLVNTIAVYRASSREVNDWPDARSRSSSNC